MRKTCTSLPKMELFYFDETCCKYSPLVSSSGAIPVTIVGGSGEIGGVTMNFLNGSEAPHDEIGADGDIYLNSTNGDLYKKQSSTWSLISNLKGDDGANWILGQGQPNVSQGKCGDFYLDMLSYDVYNRNDTSWDLIGNIKGDRGAVGSTWFIGDEAPNSSFGTVLDYYLDLTTYDIYSNDTGSWVLIGNLKGEKGFGTEEQYNDIIARLEALEQAKNEG